MARRRHPALAEHRENLGVQDRIADRITAFSGSMLFVYLHMIGFAVWMVVLERNPWPTLTLVVSLEAIFLATFVLISQNRADIRRSAIADHDHAVDCEALELLKHIAKEMGIEA